jgi:type IV pilus assembly protein PilF
MKASHYFVTYFLGGLIALTLFGCAPSASTQLNALTQAEPDSTRLRAMRRLNLASAYFEQGQIEVAQQEVRAALEIDPNFADAYSLLGLIHQRDNAPLFAQQSFEHAIQLAAGHSPQQAAIQHNLGWLFCQQNRLPEAQLQLTRAAETPGYRLAGKTWMALGVCQLRSGETADAHLSFEKSLAYDGNNVVSRYQLAKLDFQSGAAMTAQQTLSPLNASSQASADSLWLGIQLDNVLKQTQDMHKLGAQLMKKFPHSVQAQAWTDRKFQD